MRVQGIKRALTIQHVDHYAGWIRVAGNAGVISAVGQSGLCHQKSARCAAFRLLGLQGNPAPAVNAELSKILCFYSPRTRSHLRLLEDVGVFSKGRDGRVTPTWYNANVEMHRDATVVTLSCFVPAFPKGETVCPFADACSPVLFRYFPKVPTRETKDHFPDHWRSEKVVENKSYPN